MTEEHGIVMVGSNCDDISGDDRTMSEPTKTALSSEFATATETISWSSTPEAGPASTSISMPSSVYFSSRIQRIMQQRCEFSTDIDAEIEASKDHWSQMILSEVGAETNRETFQKLQQRPGSFFVDWGDALVLGQKLAEGGQAEIFEAEWTRDDGTKKNDLVVKVFKGSQQSLHVLLKQWPEGMLHKTESGRYRSDHYGYGHYPSSTCLIWGGTLLKDDKFAFVMHKYWGDLRKLIDLRMKDNHNQGPPFKNTEVEQIMWKIALGMRALHKDNILHRDLKASNVLIQAEENSNPIHDSRFKCKVADFECSDGVVGTRFWRAPEILSTKTHDCQFDRNTFTQKSDVYSYAMTCYEIITGRVPFEDLPRCAYDVVINGLRPELPNNIMPWIGNLLKRCWHHNPSERPSFEEICHVPNGMRTKKKFRYFGRLYAS